MKPALNSIARVVVCSGALLVCMRSSLAAQQSAADSAAKVVRPATCVKALKEYYSLKDIPAGYVPIMPALGGESVNGMTRIDSPEQFANLLRKLGSEAGATGILLEGAKPSGDGGGFVSGGRTLPVFVASDTARAYAACRSGSKPFG